MEVAVNVRRDLSTRQPSPKQLPARRIASAALLLRVDATASFTYPDSMRYTESAISPCERMISPAAYVRLTASDASFLKSALGITPGVLFFSMTEWRDAISMLGAMETPLRYKTAHFRRVINIDLNKSSQWQLIEYH